MSKKSAPRKCQPSLRLHLAPQKGPLQTVWFWFWWSVCQLVAPPTPPPSTLCPNVAHRINWRWVQCRRCVSFHSTPHPKRRSLSLGSASLNIKHNNRASGYRPSTSSVTSTRPRNNNLTRGELLGERNICFLSGECRWKWLQWRERCLPALTCGWLLLLLLHAGCLHWRYQQKNKWSCGATVFSDRLWQDWWEIGTTSRLWCL